MDEKKEEIKIEDEKKEIIESNSEKKHEDNEKKSDENKKEKEDHKEKSDFDEKKSQLNDKKNELIEKARENPWMVASVVLGVLLLGFFFTGSNVTGSVITGGAIAEGNMISAKIAGEKFEEFASSRGVDVEILDVEISNGLYEVSFSSDDGDSSIYITLDGENLVNGLVPLIMSDSSSSNEPESQNVPKSDNPSAELFVMTHCPFGTQAEKGFIPAIKALEGVADLNIRFVHYYMHTNNQEEVETPRQVCIREEQSEKYLDYLECFLGGTSGSVAEALACEKKVGIDSDLLANCIESERGETYYMEDSVLSEKYGVRGSPTLVINGVQANSGRDAESYLNTICSSFSEVPEECMQELSGAAPSPGFGYGASSAASSSAAQCG